MRLAFPFLQTLHASTCVFVCIQALLQRVFSAAGKIVTHQRSLSKPTKVNMLVFLARNLYIPDPYPDPDSEKEA